MAAQVAANPTVEVSPSLTNAEIAAAIQSSSLSSLAIAASSPPSISTAAPAPEATSVAPSASVSPSVSPAVSTPEAATVSPSTASVAPSTASTSPTSSTATPGRSSSSTTVESFADPLTGAQVSVTSIDGVPASYSVGPAPNSIADILGSPAVSMLANGVLSGLVPGYGPANLGVMGLTGTSIYGQGVSLATGQGLQTGGGLMGLAGSGNLGGGTGPVGGSGEAGGGGDGGGGFDSNPRDLVPTTTVDQALANQEAVRKTVAPVSYTTANFMGQPVPTAQPVSYPTYSVAIPQPRPIAYGTPYAPVGPGIASIPAFFRRPSGTTQYYG